MTWWKRVFGRDERLEELEALSEKLVEDISKQSKLSLEAARALQLLIDNERLRRQAADGC